MAHDVQKNIYKQVFKIGLPILQTYTSGNLHSKYVNKFIIVFSVFFLTGSDSVMPTNS